MFNRLAVMSALVLGSGFGCGSDHTAAGAPGSPDAASPIDASTAGDLSPAVNGFQVRTPDIVMAPGQETTYCYYFHTSNTTQTVVQNWQSSMSPGSHHIILYFTSTAEQPDGTLDPSGNCGGANLKNLSVWTYLAQTPESRSDMPADDGTGKPVGMPVPANQPAALQLHYLNATDSPLTVHITLNANGYPAGTAYTQAGSYVTYNTKIDIPPGPGSMSTASGTCPVPAGSRFFSMWTHSHKQSVENQVMDGAAMVQTSTDSSDPTVTLWPTSPFYTFASGALSYTCNYLNLTSNEIVSGPSALTNEMCMAIGYFFPATGSKVCFDSAVVN